MLALEQFRQILLERGLKYTLQRERIIRAIIGSDSHFTPENLKTILERKFSGKKIGMATIYRTLLLLEEAHFVTSISFGAEGKKYEYGLKAHHDHMICDSCGDLTEFTNDEMEELQEKIAKEHNFVITGHTMQIRGLCKKCQKA
ncbi:MAG: transcriptional repressor [Helicobacteraceae bacterium]|nr:transcriptional repressor [Helicobacteraceae bacterium]